MIRSIRLQNFKAIRDVEVNLERLTVFVGPNGSGKTSILQGLELLARSRFDHNFGFLNRRIFTQGYCDKYSADQQIELSCRTDTGEIRLRIKPDRLSSNAQISFNSPPKFEHLQIDVKDASSPEDQWNSLANLASVAESLGRVGLFRFDPNRMAEPSSNLGVELQPDGGGLASFLAFMALNRPAEFSTIQQEFSRIIPNIQRIRFDRSQSHRELQRSELPNQSRTEILIETRDEIVFDLKNGVSISALGASEGTLLVLGILAVLNGQDPQKPDLILLDDLDRGFHPLIQSEIVVLLRRILDQQPNLQIVATTHSPYLLDSLRPEEVRMTTLNDDGSVACGRLVDHPKFEQWKNEMAPGEMWSMFGEKWVSQPPAQPAESF